MSIFRNIVLASLATLGIACGSDEDKETSAQSGIRESDPDSETPSATTDELAFTGYVLNAFNVTVDDQAYADLEDFYTKEIARLPEKAKAAGFDETYNVELDAQLGFQDLWLNMQVFLSPEAKQGFQGSARVDSNGKFSVSLPKDALDATYRVRANKRISVVISKDGTVYKSCYNFSAMEKSVPFSRETKPIVLDVFRTTLTAYDCSDDTAGGLEIPARPKGPDGNVDPTSSSSSDTGRLLQGMTKAEVLDVMGRDHLRIVNGTKWCWTPAADDRLCAVNYASDCRCSVSFDSSGLLAGQDNIRSELLDVESW